MSKGPNVVDRVVAYFDEFPHAELTPKEIQERWGFSANNSYVRRYLSRAVEAGIVRLVRREKFFVPVYGKGSRRGSVPRNIDKRHRHNDGGKLLAQIWK